MPLLSRYPGWVYFFRAGDFVKIGRTGDLKQRASALRSEYGGGEMVAAVWCGNSRWLEDEMLAFCHDKLVVGRELFLLPDKDLRGLVRVAMGKALEWPVVEMTRPPVNLDSRYGRDQGTGSRRRRR